MTGMREELGQRMPLLSSCSPPLIDKEAEKFRLALSSPVGATLARGTIRDDG